MSVKDELEKQIKYPQQFTATYHMIENFDPTEHRQVRITIPTVSGAEIQKKLLERTLSLQHNVSKILNHIPAPKEEYDSHLIQFNLAELGLVYDYGIFGLIRINELLERYGMALCPDLTGPILATINSGFVTASSTHILMKPVQYQPDREGLIFSLNPKDGQRVDIDAYSTGALYHDTRVIASIK